MGNFSIDPELARLGYYNEGITENEKIIITDVLDDIKQKNKVGNIQISIKKCYRKAINSKLVFELDVIEV